MLPPKHQSRVRSRTVDKLRCELIESNKGSEKKHFQRFSPARKYGDSSQCGQYRRGQRSHKGDESEQKTKGRPRMPDWAIRVTKRTIHCCYSENSSRTHPRDWPIVSASTAGSLPPSSRCLPSFSAVAGRAMSCCLSSHENDRVLRVPCPTASRSNTPAPPE